MKALIVEDNISILTLLATYMQEEDFITDSAQDGETALDKILKNKYDIVILDIMLPGMDGFEIIREMRANRNQTPVLAISADCRVETRINALNIGADDFLVKDFDYEELVTRAKGLIRRISNNAPNILRSKELHVNLSTVSAFYKGEEIPLTKKEFQILTLLLQNKNAVVTREDLQKVVWSEKDKDMPSNTVTVHIQSLRKKLGEGGQLIRTAHGYGYIVRD